MNKYGYPFVIIYGIVISIISFVISISCFTTVRKRKKKAK